MQDAATIIPSMVQVRERLELLSIAQTVKLAEAAGVPFHTLRKLRDGETTNPRIETVRLVWAALDAMPPPADATEAQGAAA